MVCLVGCYQVSLLQNIKVNSPKVHESQNSVTSERVRLFFEITSAQGKLLKTKQKLELQVREGN